jgi:hypothetical protein
MATATSSPGVVRRTQVVDVLRSVPLGVLLPLETSLLLTIAIKRFDAPSLVKGLIAAASGLGLLASPLMTSIARKSGRPVMQLAAALSACGVFGFLTASIGSLATFVPGALVGVAVTSAVVPLLTHTYNRNFPVEERGKRVGRGLAVRVACMAVTGFVLGNHLKRHLDQWWVVVLAGAVSCAVLTALNLAMPSSPLDRVDGVRNRPWPHFHLIGEDRQLRLTLTAWMFMGFGNLMLLPLRVEYLAQERYGVNADAGKIALLTVTIPAVVRLLSLPLFGRAFDRMSFFAARIAVNLLFALYVAAFFTGTSDVGLVIGALILGVASAGGDLTWTLWVTKFAPADRVADYMGLHTFFTGIRAVSAPILAFLVIERFELSAVAWISIALIVAASLILLPEARAERSMRTVSL